jgi:PH/SEC7 domain-containing protein
MGRTSTSSLPGGSPHNILKNNRVATLKRGSIRGFPSLLGGPGGSNPYGSASSDGRVSPAPSYATSHDGGYLSTPAFVTPTLGFASNLSHTIIREAQEDDDRSVHSADSAATDIELTDAELALLGAPWAKEGMLARKHYFESAGRKARNRAWQDLFVVISRGELSMFTFGDVAGGGGGVVGGGNWLENAVPVGVIPLAHAHASALPPPGYNRQRPHCMVLACANGGTYFFQAGTDELVAEWTSTCNYWAARTSKEPLAGGVSNMEYGWSRIEDDPAPPARSTSEDARERDADAVSVRSDRSRRSRFGRAAQTVRTSPWNDRLVIHDWKPPMTSTVPSAHDEEAQLDALKKHVRAVNRELARHGELKAPMAALYRPASAQAAKADANWQRKSQYLLTESYKYETYVEALQAAMALRLRRQGEKALERALARTDAAGARGDDRGGRGAADAACRAQQRAAAAPARARGGRGLRGGLVYVRECLLIVRSSCGILSLIPSRKCTRGSATSAC